MKDIYAQVGSLENMGGDFTDAWLATEKGKQSERRETIYFETITDMYRVLSVKRIELLNRLEDALAVMSLPEKYRKRLATTNMQERLNEVIRRREKVIRIFPNEESAMRLIGALLAEKHESDGE